MTPPTKTIHALTGLAAVHLLSQIRAIMWRKIEWPPVGTPDEIKDTFDPDKDRDLETLEAIADTLADAGLAPLDFAEYEDIRMIPMTSQTLVERSALAASPGPEARAENMTTEQNTAEVIPAVGSTIVRRKFVDGEEQIGEIADTQIVKGFTGNFPSDHHEPFVASPHVARCEPTPDGLVAPAIVCESGKIIELDMFFFSWRRAEN